ncbi:MAG: DUF1659 domain-containing protein [Firmicutes bacterium]|nr:DUF1659 domain-containing protein [Bacillota bacterium]
MAQTTELGRVLQLQFNVGTTSKGEIKVKNHNFPHVNPNVADDDLLAVGNALADLFSMPLYQVARTDQVALSVDSSSS